jgi:phosphoesterase RecJ-like protein
MTTPDSHSIQSESGADAPGVSAIDGAAMHEAATAIEAASRIMLACHVNPDGDALGSVLALGTAIELRFPDKDVTMLSRDGVPDIYKFLPGNERIQRATDRSDFDLAIVLDSGDLKRVGDDIAKVVSQTPVQMDIDHHVGEGAFGRFRLLSSRAAATAEIVFDLIAELAQPITPEIARCLLTGVITDTGSFRFMNVTPRTLRVAARLIEYGASPALISEQVFDNRAFGATRLMGLALSSLARSADGRVTWAKISNADFLASGAADEETEGLINFVRAVRGTQIGLLFREAVPGVIRISLRSVEGADVAAIAAQFGGGGHRMASGCSYNGLIDDAVDAVVAACTAALPAL